MKNRKRIFIIALVLLLSVATVSLAAAMIIPSADELLTGSLETLETVSDGHAIVEATVEMPDRTVDGTLEMWGKLDMGPDGEPAFRLEVLSASEAEMIGTMAVTDGDQFWLYNPYENSVVVGNAEEMAPLLAEKMANYEGEWKHSGELDSEQLDKPETPAEAVAALSEYFTAERNGQEQVAGSDAYRLRLVPISEEMPDELRVAGGFLNVWLRVSDQLPLAAEFAESALGYAKFEASLAEINVGLDNSLFTFTIPEGTEVIQAAELFEMDAFELPPEAAAFEVLEASELPEAAVAAESQQLGSTVVQRYDLPGDLSFVIAQGPAMPFDPPAEATSSETVTIRGVEGTLFTNDDGSRSLLVWSDDDIFYLVGGDLGPDQVTAIAESLQ
jgi:outer membrane lipoprotein-sorting protein